MESLEGYRTVLMSGISAVLNLLIAFGFDLSKEQTVAILGVFNGVVVPAVGIWLRLQTTGPVGDALARFSK